MPCLASQQSCIRYTSLMSTETELATGGSGGCLSPLSALQSRLLTNRRHLPSYSARFRGHHRSERSISKMLQARREKGSGYSTSACLILYSRNIRLYISWKKMCQLP